MRGVDRDVVAQQHAELLVRHTHERLRTAPEQPVMHDEEIGTPHGGLGNRGPRRVNRHGNTVHAPTVGHLQPVHRRAVVRDIGGTERGIQRSDDILKRSGWSHDMGDFGDEDGGLPAGADPIG